MLVLLSVMCLLHKKTSRLHGLFASSKILQIAYHTEYLWSLPKFPYFCYIYLYSYFFDKAYIPLFNSTYVPIIICYEERCEMSHSWLCYRLFHNSSSNHFQDTRLVIAGVSQYDAEVWVCTLVTYPRK